MKKILVLILSISLLITMSACGGSSSDETVQPKSDEKVKPVELTLCVPDPESSSIGVAAAEFAKRLNEESKGALKVNTYYNGSIYGGDSAAGVKQLSAGGLDVLILSTSLYASFNPNFNVMSVPYMFDDVNQFVDYLNSNIGKELMSSVNSMGIEHLGSWTRSFRHITNSVRPINEPADLEGIVLRVPNNPLWVEFFSACGANCTPMSFSEVYNALQLNTLQGQENPVDVPMSNKFYEVQKYISMTGHMADGWLVGMNQKKYQNLPDDMQALIKEVASDMQQWKIKYDGEQDAQALQDLIDNGMEANDISDENRQKFVEVSQSIYDKFKELVENDELFDETVKFVGKVFN